MQRSRRICHDTVALAKEILAWTNCHSCLLKEKCDKNYNKEVCTNKIQNYLEEFEEKMEVTEV